jgi:hypothetical protein
MSNIVKNVISLCTLIGIVFGAYFFMERHYALAEDFKQLEQRFNYKTLFDQRQAVQQQIWEIERSYPNGNMPILLLQEYKSLQVQKQQFDAILNNMQQQQLQMKGR